MLLLQRMKQGDQQAFATIFEQHWRQLVDFAFRRLQLLQDAEEIVQDVFVRLYERRQELDIQTSLSAYLHSAVRYRVYNKYRDWLRQKKSYLVPNLDDIDYAIAPTDTISYKELENHIRQAVHRLPEKCREVFLLSREQHLSNKEVAEKLGISLNTVEKHIGNALRVLRQEMEKYDRAVVFCLIAVLGF